jgi:integrase
VTAGERRLLNAIPICLNPPRKLEPHTLRSILLLLYGAGLRIGEVVALTVADVDISASVITIRNAKFHKTRLMPKHLSLSCAEERLPQSKSFSARLDAFVSRRVFLAKMAARYQPRLHDMRHYSGNRIIPAPEPRRRLSGNIALADAWLTE